MFSFFAVISMPSGSRKSNGKIGSVGEESDQTMFPTKSGFGCNFELSRASAPFSGVSPDDVWNLPRRNLAALSSCSHQGWKRRTPFTAIQHHPREFMQLLRLVSVLLLGSASPTTSQDRPIIVALRQLQYFS